MQHISNKTYLGNTCINSNFQTDIEGICRYLADAEAFTNILLACKLDRVGPVYNTPSTD